MPYVTLKTRIKTGTSDDSSPNSSEPGAADITELPTSNRASAVPARGWTYFLDFLDSNGAPITDGVADVTPWVKDEDDGVWLECEADESVGHRQLMQVDPPLIGAQFFFQLTNISGTGIATIRVRVGSL